MKGYPAANKMLDKWGDRFKKIFGITLGSFMGMGVIFGIQDFDVVKFNDYLCRLGYQIKKEGSMKDYVEKYYGQEGVDLFDELIGKKK